jgi:hypothetical protein
VRDTSALRFFLSLRLCLRRCRHDAMSASRTARCMALRNRSNNKDLGAFVFRLVCQSLTIPAYRHQNEFSHSPRDPLVTLGDQMTALSLSQASQAIGLGRITSPRTIKARSHSASRKEDGELRDRLTRADAFGEARAIPYALAQASRREC